LRALWASRDAHARMGDLGHGWRHPNHPLREGRVRSTLAPGSRRERESLDTPAQPCFQSSSETLGRGEEHRPLAAEAASGSGWFEVLCAGRLKQERLCRTLLPEDERELLGRPQAVGVRRPEGRAGLLLRQRAKHVLVEEAVLAARLTGRPWPCPERRRCDDAALNRCLEDGNDHERHSPASTNRCPDLPRAASPKSHEDLFIVFC
jgi:hypothetical protein